MGSNPTPSASFKVIRSLRPLDPPAGWQDSWGFWGGPIDRPSREKPENRYPSGEPHLPFQVKPLSSVLMDDLKVAHKYGGDDGA